MDVYNGGVGGQTSTQIKNRMVSAYTLHGYPTTIWAGRNNTESPETVKADIATMVGMLATDNYIVLSIFPSAEFQEQSGGANKSRLDTLNADLAVIYGSKFLDTRALLQANGNGSGDDNAAIAADLIPVSLRSDATHLNAAGYALVAAEVLSMLGL